MRRVIAATCTAGALLAAVPALAEILSGEDIQLHGASIRAASAEALSNDSETLHLTEPSLGVLGAGTSLGGSGIQLHVGVAPAPIPEPAALWQLAAGVLSLGLLQRVRRRRGA